MLESSVEDPSVRERRIKFLAGLSPSHREGEVLYVHGSPRNRLNEYVFPEDIYNERKMGKLGTHFDRVCFNGHTHVPGVFVEYNPGKWEFLGPEECVGGYVLFDDDAIWFRRVEYDVEATIRKIYAVPVLDNFFADRLRDGR